MKTPLQRARERAEVTQEALGTAIGLSQASISDFERSGGDGVPIRRPDPVTAEAIVRFFHKRGIASLNEMKVMYPERYA